MRASGVKLIKQLLLIGLLIGFISGFAAPSEVAAQAEKVEPYIIKPKAHLKRNSRTANKQERLWRSLNITNYQFDFQWLCFCPEEYWRPVTITVQNGVITQVQYKHNGVLVPPDEFDRYRTIEQLFALIHDAIDRKVDNLEVTYDANYGYPLTLFIDYDVSTIDEEMRFRIENFTPLK